MKRLLVFTLFVLFAACDGNNTTDHYFFGEGDSFIVINDTRRECDDYMQNFNDNDVVRNQLADCEKRKGKYFYVASYHCGSPECSPVRGVTFTSDKDYIIGQRLRIRLEEMR